MPTKPFIAGAVLGSLATVALGLGYGYRNQRPLELPSVWHDVAAVPEEDREFTNWWNDLGNRAHRATLEHPREKLHFSCAIKTEGRPKKPSPITWPRAD